MSTQKEETKKPKNSNKKGQFTERDDSYSDHAEFWARRMRQGGSFSHTHIEKPVMYEKMRPLIEGATILSIGCGSGEECEEIRQMGAEKVVGTDISEGLIEQAKKAFPEVEFHAIPGEDHSQFEDNSFDVIYSSLTMHYIKDWRRTFEDYLRILKPGGTFLFSANHPIRRGMTMIRRPNSRITTMLLGYSADPDHQQIRIFGDYLNKQKIHDRFMKKIQVTFYNRPFSMMWKEITDAGFEIADIVEPKPIQKDVPQSFAGFNKITDKIPYFIIFELRKPE